MPEAKQKVMHLSFGHFKINILISSKLSPNLRTFYGVSFNEQKELKMTNKENLKNTFLFENLTESELLSVAGLCNKRNIKAGEVLITSGETLTKMFIVIYGTFTMNIIKDDGIEETIINVGNDQIIGFEGFYGQDEISLFTTKAIENSTVLEISYPHLEILLNQNFSISQKCHKSFLKFYSNVMHTLVVKLTDSNTSKFL